MKKAQKTRLLRVGSLAMAAALLTACGSGTSSSSSAAASESASEAESVSSEAETAAADGPAWNNDTSPVDLEWFVGASWYGYTWGESVVSKNITEKTGVNVTITTPTDDVSTELSLYMVSGDLPDIITLGNWESCYTSLYEQGYVYALNELADQYDPYFYNVVDGDVIKWHTKDDGNVYCIPNDAYAPSTMAETGQTAAVQTFLVRKDLYEEMGSPDMTTPEGFLDALRTLHENYQEYDGMAITPFYAQAATTYGMSKMLQNFLAVPYEVDGEINDRTSDPEYIKWLKMFRQAYEEGLIDVDFLVDSNDQVKEKTNNGQYFCMLREYTDVQEANGILASSDDPDSIYIAVDGPMNSAKDDPLIFPGSMDGWMTTFISKDCENPERAIAFLTYLCSEEGQMDMFMGVEGETYDMVDGKPVLKEELQELYSSNFDSFSNDYGLYDTYWMLRNKPLVDQWRMENPDYITQMSDWANAHADLDGGIYNNLEPTGDNDAGIAATSISQKWEEVLPQLITAESDEKFDQIMADYVQWRENNGYAQVVEYEQNLLDTRKEMLS